MKAKFPHCPKGLDSNSYSYYLDQGQCWFLSQGICSEHCHHIEVDEDGFYPVEFDHVDAVSTGGSDTPYNIRPVCRSYNRFKSNKDIGHYHEPSWFDHDLTLASLRPWQRELYEKVSVGSLAPLYEDPSLSLLSTFALLTWTVGAGKTLGWVAFACGINKARAFRGVRVKRVLFLVQQRDLVANIAAELSGAPKEKSDIEKYLGIKPPRVFQLTNSDEWDCNECQIADVVATCPQALWGFGASEKKTRQLRQKYLGGFDLIVIDEGHFAVHQYTDFLVDAPNAFKLIMSATPMDGGGKYLSSIPEIGPRFKYINVFADYTRVRNEGCLKMLSSWEEGTEETPKEWGDANGHFATYVNGPNYFCHRAHNGTYLNDNGAVEIDPLSPNQAISHAIKLANRIDEYDAQVLVKTENRHIAQHIVKHLDEKNGKGFATAVYTGNRKGQRLDKNHPWMKGKSTVLAAIDMAQFGLNRPECTIIVWVAKNLSLVEIIQRIGRALRIVKGVPPSKQVVKLIWTDPSMTPFIRQAIELIRDSISEIKQNFEPIESLLEGLPGYALVKPITPPTPGLIPAEKQKVEAVVLTHPTFTPSKEDLADLATEIAGKDATPEAKKRTQQLVEDYARHVADPRFASTRIKNIDDEPKGWLRLLLSAEADPKSVTKEDMKEFIKTMRIGEADKQGLLALLEVSKDYREDIYKRVVESRENMYKPMTNGYHPSVIVGTKTEDGVDSYRREIWETHFKTKEQSKELNTERKMAINEGLCVVLKQALDIRKFSDTKDGYKEFSAQLATALMTEKVRSTVIKMANWHCYGRYPEIFKPYHRLLEVQDNA